MKTLDKKLEESRRPLVKVSSYSIEYAHIYTDESFNQNHTMSIDIRNEVLKANPNMVNVDVVLIDNYNAENAGFSIVDFLERLNQNHALPDYYILEADLARYADSFIDSFKKEKIKRMYKNYHERKGKYPCSLLTALWYLIRLGAIDADDIIRPAKNNNSPFRADRLINILPAGFKNVEKEAHKLIGLSSHSEQRYKIQPILYQETLPIRHTSHNLLT